MFKTIKYPYLMKNGTKILGFSKDFQRKNSSILFTGTCTCFTHVKTNLFHYRCRQHAVPNTAWCGLLMTSLTRKQFFLPYPFQISFLKKLFFPKSIFFFLLLSSLQPWIKGLSHTKRFFDGFWKEFKKKFWLSVKKKNFISLQWYRYPGVWVRVST